MSSNNTTTPVFGRLNWNISGEVRNTLTYISIWTETIGAIFEITVITFFIRSFCIKKSKFREPYFIIYTMGCFVDAAPKVMNFVLTYININIVFAYVNVLVFWYNPNFITLWNLLLAVNRFIAILFTLQFSKIWSKRNTTIICIFLIIYPFIIHIHNPVYLWCQLTYVSNFRTKMCLTTTFTNFEYVFAFVSDSTYALLATVLCTIAALKIVIKKQMKNQNVEKVLLIQSFTSSIFLVLSTALSWLASVNISLPADAEKSEQYRVVYLNAFLNLLSKLFYNLHHYIGLTLLLIMSRNFRTQYLEFYKITVILKCLQKTIKHKSEGTITVVPPVSVQTTPRIAHTNSTFLH